MSALLLGAHYFRGGSWALAAAFALSPLVLATRRRLARRALSIVLFAGALEWIRTLVVQVGRRQAVGEPWERLALILGAVAVFTVISGFAVRRGGRGGGGM